MATYDLVKEHFVRSAFSDQDLAIEAYDHVPSKYLLAFETTIGRVNSSILVTVDTLQQDAIDKLLNS